MSYSNYAGYTQENFSPDTLIADPRLVVTEGVTIAAGQTLSRGAVLGQITASGDYVLSISTAADGSQTPVAILADAVNSTAGAVSNVPIYVMGEFDANAVTLGSGITLAAATTDLALKGIFLRSAVKNDYVF